MSQRTTRWLIAAVRLAGRVLPCAFMPFAAAQEQYPKPLIHTPTDHPAARVLLLSIDGLHAVDFANWVAAHPHSTLAELSARGVTYTNAHTPLADPAAGLVALATGGTPISTGILSSDGYDHALSPPNSNCKTKGAVLALDAAFDSSSRFDPTKARSTPPTAALPSRPTTSSTSTPSSRSFTKRSAPPHGRARAPRPPTSCADPPARVSTTPAPPPPQPTPHQPPPPATRRASPPSSTGSTPATPPPPAMRPSQPSSA